MNLQPLYDVKARLEQAAVAGTGLLGEDFRLTRAAEGLKPLAAASPVFAKIDAGLFRLLSAPAGERAVLLLDVLALTDAVACTQAKTGRAGELIPLDVGSGSYHQISCGQISPLLIALTTTGGGRMEAVQSAWESHPEFFADFRVLPAVVAGLGDSYNELAELNAKILKQTGPAALPLLKKDFDPAGNRAMARRVEVISAIEGAKATPWLREILPQAKKDVRAAVLTALGNDPANTALLLELVKTERGANRDAVLESLSRQDGADTQAFWTAELSKNSGSVKFLESSDADWAGSLVAAGLRSRLDKLLAEGGRVSAADQKELSLWCQAIGKKASPVMVDFWRWSDEHMEAFDQFTNEKGNPVFAGVRLTDTLRDCLCRTGPGPLRDFCRTLWERRPAMTRYLHISFHAALLSLPAAEVYDRYGPRLLTEEPVENMEYARTLNNVLLRALGDVAWDAQRGCHILAGVQPTAEPLDKRWVERLTRAIWKDVPRKHNPNPFVYWENVEEFDLTLMRLADQSDEETQTLLIPYLRHRLDETNLPYSYSRWLFQLGGSPKGVLGCAMVINPKANRVGSVWELMNEAAKVLPAGEVTALLREVLDSKCIYKGAQERLENAISRTIEQLDAGRSFPPLDEWTRA